MLYAVCWKSPTPLKGGGAFGKNRILSKCGSYLLRHGVHFTRVFVEAFFKMAMAVCGEAGNDVDVRVEDNLPRRRFVVHRDVLAGPPFFAFFFAGGGVFFFGGLVGGLFF